MSLTTFCAKGGCASGKGLLVIGGPDEFHSAYKAGYKSHKNRELRKLNGLRGSMRFNAAKTCKVLHVGTGSGSVLVGELGTLMRQGFTKEGIQAQLKAGTAWTCYDTNGGGCAPLIVIIKH